MSLASVHTQIKNCDLCPRLRNHCAHIAEVKRRAFLDQKYWGRPVAGFGDPEARLIIVGLAPAAHGANRTGRIFTGDRSGDWLYGALYRAGFSNQPHAVSKDDGLKLTDVYITSVVKCAPPENKPNREEIEHCQVHLKKELALLKRTQIYLALGQIALQGLWPLITPPAAERSQTRRPQFGHGKQYELPGRKTLLLSYHPSQQNTFTGRLTQTMFDSVFSQARKLLA